LVASALFNVEDHKNCEMLFVKYVKLIEKNYGTKSLEMSNCYFMIGGFYYQLDMFPKALESFKRSFEVRKAKLGEKHESVGDCWYNMALVYKHMGKMIKAILILEKAYDQRKEAKGEISLPCALVLEVLGKVFLENGNYKASLMKFQECYNVRKKILNNAKHPELIRISLLIMHLQKMVVLIFKMYLSLSIKKDQRFNHKKRRTGAC
jgi:tetratricopeptide (TPR) repeat protein